MSKQQKIEWLTVRRRVDDLVGHPKNPRVLDDNQLAALTRSLKKFNLAELPVIDTNNMLLAGHQRIKVLQLLGRGGEEIEVRYPSRPLTEKEAETYLLTSNAVHGSWSFDLLKTFETDLLLEIGFNMEDLNGIFDSLEIEDDHWETDKEIKKIGKPIVKLGELYALGNHRLLVGDSRDEAAVRRLVGKEKIDLVDAIGLPGAGINPIAIARVPAGIHPPQVHRHIIGRQVVDALNHLLLSSVFEMHNPIR